MYINYVTYKILGRKEECKCHLLWRI